MTDITHHSSRVTAFRRLAIATLVATIGLASMATGSTDAARRTKSEMVAAEAGRALDALASWRSSQSPVDYVRFVQGRELTAAMTAADLDADADQLRDEWASVSIDKQTAALSALSQLGVPYRSLTSKPGVGFDCSGLTIWAFDQASIEIPRVSRDQFRASIEVDHDDAEAGDLVYYPGHISIYLGAELMVHSPNSGSHVEAAHLPDKSLSYGDIVGAMAESEAADAAVEASALDRFVAP
jgi:cell wall-associated NlpC family hydrolase